MWVLVALVVAAGLVVFAARVVRLRRCCCRRRASAEERELLLPSFLDRQETLSSSTLSTMSPFGDCKNAQELEQVLAASDRDLLLESQSEALSLVQHCRAHCSKLSTLSARSLARVVSALHPHASSPQVAKFVQECLCAKTAEDCSALKMEVDQLVSLYDLLYSALGSKNARHEILSHFDTQARRVKETQLSALPLKLISCIEGAVYSTASDSRYPKHTIYPGARQFALEVLSSVQAPQREITVFDSPHEAESDGRDRAASHRQVFLMDHPETMKGQIRGMLEQSGFTPITVLAGNVMNLLGAKWVMANKLERIKRLVRIFGEFQFVFVGALSDVELAKELASHPQTYSMAAVMIQDGSPDASPVYEQTGTASSGDDSTHYDRTSAALSVVATECEAAGVLVFQTYADATSQLAARGVLSARAKGSVIWSAVADVSAIKFESEEQKRSATKQAMAGISSVIDRTLQQDAMLVLEAFHLTGRRRAQRHDAGVHQAPPPPRRAVVDRTKA